MKKKRTLFVVFSLVFETAMILTFYGNNIKLAWRLHQKKKAGDSNESSDNVLLFLEPPLNENCCTRESTVHCLRSATIADIYYITQHYGRDFHLNAHSHSGYAYLRILMFCVDVRHSLRFNSNWFSSHVTTPPIGQLTRNIARQIMQVGNSRLLVFHCPWFKK